MRRILFFILSFFFVLPPVYLFSEADIQLKSEENVIRNFQINVPPGLKNGDYLEIRLRHLNGGEVKWIVNQKNTLFKRTIFQKLKAWFLEESAFKSFTGSNVDGTFRGYLTQKVEFRKNDTIIRFAVKRDYSTVMIKPISEWTSLLIRELKYQANEPGEIAIEYRMTGLKGYDKWISAFDYKHILIDANCSLRKDYAFIVRQDSSLKESVSLSFSIDNYLLKDPDFDTLKVTIMPISNSIRFTQNSDIKVYFNRTLLSDIVFVENSYLHVRIPRQLLTKRKKHEIRIEDIGLQTLPIRRDLFKQKFRWVIDNYKIGSITNRAVNVFSLRMKQIIPLMITDISYKYEIENPFYSEDVTKLSSAGKKLVMEISPPYSFIARDNKKSEIPLLPKKKSFSLSLREKTSKRAALRIKAYNLDNTIEIPEIAYYCEVKNITLKDIFFTDAGINVVNRLKIELGDGSGIPRNTDLVFVQSRGKIFFKSPDELKVTYEKRTRRGEVKKHIMCNNKELRVKILNEIPPNATILINGIKIMIPQEMFQTRYDTLGWLIPGHAHPKTVSTLYPVKIKSELESGNITIVPFLNDTTKEYSLSDIVMDCGALADKIFTPGHSILLKLEYKGDISWNIDQLKQSKYFNSYAVNYNKGKRNILEFPIKRKFDKNAKIKLSGLAISNVKKAFEDLTIKISFDDENSVVAKMINSVKIRSPVFNSVSKQYVFSGDYKFRKYMIEMDFSEIRDFFKSNKTVKIIINSDSYKLDPNSKIKIYDKFGFEITGFKYQISDNYLEITFSRENVRSLKRFYLANLQLLKKTPDLVEESIEFTLLDMYGNILQKDQNNIIIKKHRRDVSLIQNNFLEKMYLTSSGNYFVIQSKYSIFQDLVMVNIDTTILGVSDSTFKRIATSNSLKNALKIEFDKGIPVTNQTVIIKNLPLNYPSMIGSEDLKIIVRNWYGFFDVNELDDCNLINMDIRGEQRALEINSIDLVFNRFDVSGEAWNTYRKLISIHNAILNLENLRGLSDAEFRNQFNNINKKFIEIETLSGIKDWWHYWWIRAFLTSMYIRRWGETDNYNNYNRDIFYSEISNAKIRGWVQTDDWFNPPSPEQIPGIVRKFQEAIKVSRYIDADNYLNQFLRVNIYDYFQNNSYPEFEKGKGGEYSYNRFLSDLFKWRALTSLYLEDYFWAEAQLNEARSISEMYSMSELIIGELDSLQKALEEYGKNGTKKVIKFSPEKFPENRISVSFSIRARNAELTDIKSFLPIEDKSMVITYDMPVKTYSGQNIRIEINDSKSLVKRNLIFLGIGIGLLIWANY